MLQLDPISRTVYESVIASQQERMHQVTEPVELEGASEDCDHNASIDRTFSLFPVRSRETLAQLHAFRIEFERVHGPTPDREYASQLPTSVQMRLWRDDPKQYFSRLPPFAAAFYERACLLHARSGSLDDVPSPFIALFVEGKGRIR